VLPNLDSTHNLPTGNEAISEQQLSSLSNAALRDLLKEKNLSTNGHKQVLIQRLLSGESRRPVTRNRNNNTEREDMEGQLSGLSGENWSVSQKLSLK